MDRKNDFPAVYAIVCSKTDKIYVGSTKNFRHRKSQHFSLLNKHKHYVIELQQDFDVYGSDNFSFVLLEPCSSKDNLLDREQFWIDTIRPEYNKSDSAIYGKYEMTDDIKSKISQSVKKLHADGKYDFRKGINYFLKDGKPCRLGVKLSDETKEKVRQANLGEKNPNYGKPRSQGFMDKMRKSYPGVISPDGVIYSPITGLNKFCSEHGLDSGGMSRLLQGKIKSYKGWKSL